MTYPKGTLIRNTASTRINHWITATCFVLLMLSGLAMFYPMLFFLSGLFGGGQWTRAIHPWIRESSSRSAMLGWSCSFVARQFMEPRRYRVDARVQSRPGQ